MRLDDLLVDLGYFPDRAGALRAVLAHTVRVDDVYPTSAAIKVSSDADILVKGAKRYVSRGGFKLQGGIDAFGVDVSGLRCIDVGSSTGGFTDCLLQAGAASVTCVDVNYGQLAFSLREDERVTVFERTNIRTADPAALGAPFDVVVADLSFIGLAGLAGVFASLCAEGSLLLALIKPQFESAHQETQRGIVTDPQVRARVVDEVSTALTEAGFAVMGVVESPIKGAAGNVEYMVAARLNG
ncbi:MAG: TlyA family RNA methyltransferase [Eggerthellales bacterium]|nr:TlyA family RNA methyltransferase [Eggerthellales bacterium]